MVAKYCLVALLLVSVVSSTSTSSNVAYSKSEFEKYSWMINAVHGNQGRGLPSDGDQDGGYNPGYPGDRDGDDLDSDGGNGGQDPGYGDGDGNDSDGGNGGQNPGNPGNPGSGDGDGNDSDGGNGGQDPRNPGDGDNDGNDPDGGNGDRNPGDGDEADYDDGNGGDQDEKDSDGGNDGDDSNSHAGGRLINTKKAIHRLIREKSNDALDDLKYRPDDFEGRVGNIWWGVDYSFTDVKFKDFEYNDNKISVDFQNDNEVVITFEEMSCVAKFKFDLDSPVTDAKGDGKAYFKDFDYKVVYALSFDDNSDGGQYLLEVKSSEILIKELDLKLDGSIWNRLAGFVTTFIIDDVKENLNDDLVHLFDIIGEAVAEQFVNDQSPRQWLTKSKTVGIDVSPVEDGDQSFSTTEETIESLVWATFFTENLNASSWDQNRDAFLAGRFKRVDEDSLQFSMSEFSLNSFGWLWYNDHDLSEGRFKMEVDEDAFSVKILAHDQDADYILETSVIEPLPKFEIGERVITATVTQEVKLTDEDFTETAFNAIWSFSVELDVRITDDVEIGVGLDHEKILYVNVIESTSDWSARRVEGFLKQFLEKWTEDLEDHALEKLSFNPTWFKDIRYEDISLSESNLIFEIDLDL